VANELLDKIEWWRIFITILVPFEALLWPGILHRDLLAHVTTDAADADVRPSAYGNTGQRRKKCCSAPI
jgi:hypothetical protein